MKRPRRQSKLTSQFIEALLPEEKEYSVYDTLEPSLAVRVRPEGAKSFVTHYRTAGGRKGKWRPFTIGPCVKLSLTDARRSAAKVTAEATLGGDPAADKSAKRTARTVSELCDDYFKAGANGNKPGTIYRDKGRVLRHIVPLIGKKAAREVTSADIENLRVAISTGKTAGDVKTGPRGRAIIRGGDGAARRVVGLLGSIFAYAVRARIRPDNPVRGIRRGKDGKRQRFLSISELLQLGDALRDFEKKGTNRKALDILRLLIFTGARKNEIASLKWNGVDLERGLLNLGDSKTGPKTIILPAPATALLAALEHEEDQVFVFPTDDGTSLSHFQGTEKIWRKVRDAAALQGLRIHDLRHSFASIALARGATLPVIGKLLGHSSPQVTARYSHLDADPVRRVADDAASAIDSAMKGTPQAPLAKAAKTDA